MAAHSLTIARQILAMPDDKIVKYAESSLPAPGWDSLPWSSMTYHSFSDAVKRGDVHAVRQYAHVLEQESMYLEAYGIRTFDQYKRHWEEHVKWGKPYHHKRNKAYFAGTLKSALKAATPEAVEEVRNIVKPRKEVA